MPTGIGKKEHFKSKADRPAACGACLLCVAGFHRGDIARLGNVGMKMADSKVLQPPSQFVILPSLETSNIRGGVTIAILALLLMDGRHPQGPEVNPHFLKCVSAIKNPGLSTGAEGEEWLLMSEVTRPA